MSEWKLITKEVPAADGTYMCTIEATEGDRTWRFTAECDFTRAKEHSWFILNDDGEYCDMYDYSGWTGDWGPFDDDESYIIHCKLIAWMPTPEPYTGDGYTGKIS